MKLRILISLVILSGPFLFVRTQAQPATDKPSLIVGIVVDGMKYDWIERYWNLFSEGGIKKLFRQGTQYTNTSVPFLLADVASSCASISTGAPPAIHGIVSEDWYSRLRRESVHCSGDYLAKSVGGTGTNGKHSASNLLSNTIGDQIILNSDYRGKVISVSFRPDAAILLEGHIPGSAYWFETTTGNFITSSQYANTLPQWVQNYNDRNASDHYLTRDWAPLLADNLYSGCPPDDNDLETGYFDQFKTFPYKLSRIRRESLGQDYEILGMLPYGNTLTTDFAATALQEEGLGMDSFTDLLWVSYTSINRINKLFGPDSREVADALLRLDLDLQRLINQVEERVGKDKALIFLTSTHGAVMDPDYSRALNLPGGFFRYRNAVTLLNSYLSAIYGEGNWVEYYVSHQLYLNETLIDQKNISFTIIQDQASRFLTHFDGVARAVSADRMISGEVNSSWGDMIQNSFNPDRTGDIILILQPGWIEEENTDSDSRSPYTYDTHVPLTWYGWKVARQNINHPVTILDIAPTLSHILGISAPGGATGKILHDLIK